MTLSQQPDSPATERSKAFLCAMSWTAWLLCVGVICQAIVYGSHKQAPRPELRHGTPTADYLERNGYILGRPGHYTPWVLEHLTADNLAGNVSRDGFDFVEDPETPIEFRARHGFYRKSGYDIGHLPSAANHRSSVMEMRDCFRLSAMCPQTAELNRSNEAWEGLEDYCRKVALSGCEIWVCSGPAFVPGDAGEIHVKTLGDGVCWVPTHCFKTALIQRGENVGLKAWLLPNTHNPPHWNDCELTVDELEKLTALDFWSGLDADLQEKLEAAK